MTTTTSCKHKDEEWSDDDWISCACKMNDHKWCQENGGLDAKCNCKCHKSTKGDKGN